jgi:choline-sulfatase
MLDEVSRAELDASGLLIDLGTPDQHKYTRGGWRTGWGTNAASDETSWAPLIARSGYLDLTLPAAVPTELVARARSRAANQTLTWMIGEREIGETKIGREWSEIRLPIPADAIPKDHRIRLELRASAGAVAGVRAELDWVWLSTSRGSPPLGPRAVPLQIAGKTRRALPAPTARTYTFHLQAPPTAELVVDLGASDRAEFVITATTDDGKRRELLRETVSGGWTERAIALAAVAGRAVRLELETIDPRGTVGWGEPELMIEHPTPVARPAGNAPRNVILLVIDTARADAFGPFARPDRVVKTPVFDGLAARSTVFANAYNNENWTKPSVATTLSGLYPSSHGAKQDASKLSSDVELLNERLARDGFATAGFVANGYVSKVFGFEQGWDVFRNYIRENKASESEHVFADALAWHARHLEKHPDEPYFLYLQTIDPHVTYRVDQEFWSPYFEGEYDGPLGPSIGADDQVKLSSKKLAGSARDVAWLRALYWGEIAYHDAQLGKLLAELEARNALADTMLVITNDHGEELGERGRFGHGHQVFEEMIRAPLIIHYPPRFAATVIPEIVEHVDLAPTILEVLGKSPLKDADGISLVPLLRGQPISQPPYAVTEFLDSRRVLRVGSWKLVERANGESALFDVVADPMEQRDLETTAPIAGRLCAIHLGEALATRDKSNRMMGIGNRRQFQGGEATIGPQMRRQLEALGYFGSGPEPEDKAK